MLGQLAQTGLCHDPSKIWWDMSGQAAVFRRLEMRICDVCTTLEDTITIAALYQSILGGVCFAPARKTKAGANIVRF